MQSKYQDNWKGTAKTWNISAKKRNGWHGWQAGGQHKDVEEDG